MEETKLKKGLSTKKIKYKYKPSKRRKFLSYNFTWVDIKQYKNFLRAHFLIRLFIFTS